MGLNFVFSQGCIPRPVSMSLRARNSIKTLDEKSAAFPAHPFEINQLFALTRQLSHPHPNTPAP